MNKNNPDYTARRVFDLNYKNTNHLGGKFMLLRQIGFALISFVLLTPAFANQCPSPEKIGNSQLRGWSEMLYYTDKEKTLAFQKELVENTGNGRELRCYYSYFDPDTHRMMPPALVLRTIIN